MKLFFGLPYLKPEEVGDYFVFDFFEITEFCDYFVHKYVRENATFSSFVWASPSDSMTRTTNSCEAFHSLFILAIRKFSSLWKYLKNVSTNKYVKKRPHIEKRKLYLSEKLENSTKYVV